MSIDNTAPRSGTGRALTYHAVTLGTFLAASAAPTPLYRLYQETFAISPAVIASVFAVYAFALLKALLIAGSLSDHLGRRPVIFGAVLAEMVAMALFLVADSSGWLIAARIIQGAATGIATASIGAALIDLDRTRGQIVNSIMPLAGMAAGALGTSALIQYGPAPLHLTFAVLLILFACLACAIWLTPETTQRRSGALQSMRPRIAVPPAAKRPLALITPFNVANWMLAGFYLSLVPSVVIATTGNRAPLVGGAVVTGLMVAGVITNLLRRASSPRSNLVGGTIAMTAGVIVLVIGVHASSIVLLMIGTMLGGAGFGACFLGCIGSIVPLATADQRAGLLAYYYVQSYLAFSIPAILAGFVVKWAGYAATADLYALAIIALNAFGMLGLRTRTKEQGRTEALCANENT